MRSVVENKSRLDVVDALRGFDVVVILLVHNIEHFIFLVYPMDSPAWLSALDNGVGSVVFVLFAGRAYAIFALLLCCCKWWFKHHKQDSLESLWYRWAWFGKRK